MINNSRRNFFKGLNPKNISNTIKGQNNHIFPPYNSDKTLFSKLCYECNDKYCMTACPEKIIEIYDHLPRVNLNKGYCTFCSKCMHECKYTVLDSQNHEYINATFIINKKTCLAWNYTICETCRDACNYKAINFNAIWDPNINELCTACGHCLHVCPVKAITFT